LKQFDPKLSSAIQLPLQSSNFLPAWSRHLILCWHQRRPRVVWGSVRSSHLSAARRHGQSWN